MTPKTDSGILQAISDVQDRYGDEWPTDALIWLNRTSKQDFGCTSEYVGQLADGRQVRLDHPDRSGPDRFEIHDEVQLNWED